MTEGKILYPFRQRQRRVKVRGNAMIHPDKVLPKIMRGARDPSRQLTFSLMVSTVMCGAILAVAGWAVLQLQQPSNDQPAVVAPAETAESEAAQNDE